jgi:hypothetical protein
MGASADEGKTRLKLDLATLPNPLKTSCERRYHESA